MRRRYKYFFSTLLALLLASFAGFATSASAQDEREDDELLDEYDANQDGVLDEDEFGENYDGFDELDVNEDGVLDEDEFNSGSFDSLDGDEDGFLDDDEFDR